MEKFETNEKVEIPIELSFYFENEVARVMNTIKRYAWYTENKYRPSLPEGIKFKLDNGQEVSEEDIRIALEKEYKEDTYKKEEEEIMKSWESESAGFLEKLKSLGRPLPDRFYIFLTAYGVGGSYGYPDKVYINMRNTSKAGILGTIFHEMVHLVIEDLIQKNNIPHWTKERIVNLIMNKFSPDKPIMQRDPENAKEIGEIFEREFPDVERIISEISKLNSQ
jgi:hypothetical protein